MKQLLKLLLFFPASLISCGDKSRDKNQKLILNSADENDSVIILQSLTNTTAIFYYIKSFTGTPLNLMKGDVIKVVSKRPFASNRSDVFAGIFYFKPE